MNYNFSQDIIDGENGEKRVADLFQYKCPQITSITYNKDCRYDLVLNLNDQRIITVEVKTDYFLHKTGNIAIENKCRGKDSGINVTQSDLFVIYNKTRFKEHVYVFKTSWLKNAILSPFYKRVIGGDIKQGQPVTEMVLIPLILIPNKYVDLMERKEIKL